jgi:putative addiction module component (TIGR02574 family)
MDEPERKPIMPPQTREASTADVLEEAALRLPVEARAALAARLLDSLDERPLQDLAEVERAWDEAIRRRVEDLRSGRAKTRPVEEFLAELEDRTR